MIWGVLIRNWLMGRGIEKFLREKRLGDAAVCLRGIGIVLAVLGGLVH
jgi:hypothetical protein